MFRNEDSGPPELTEEQIQELDCEAMVTEINRLTEMQAVARKPLQELQRVEERETGFRNGKWTRRARLVAKENFVVRKSGTTLSTLRLQRH